MKTLKLSLIVLSVALLGYGIGRAQDDFRSPDATAYRTARQNAASGTPGETFDVFVDAVANSPRSPGATKQGLRYLLQNAVQKGDYKAEGQAVIIAQNARIIELLEQINKKGREPQELPYAPPKPKATY